jgi:transcriptional regulator GlxA family with amidase domain
MRRLHFVVVAVERTLASAVVGPIELVQLCKQLQTTLPEIEPCEITAEILSPDGQPVVSTYGYRLAVDGPLRDLPTGSVILLPGFGLPRPDNVPGLLEQHAVLGRWLQQQHAAGHTIVASCSGSFLLAEYGLFRSGRATTYWPYADLFRQRYPRLELDLDALIVSEERLFSLGGAVCGLEAVLLIVERFAGKELARLCTKMLVMESRPPSELRYERRQPTVYNDALIQRIVSWIRDNLHTRLTVDDLLRRVPTSRRSLNRRFKLETGEGIQAFIQRMRIERAKLLLETGSVPIEQIVERVGYRDASALARQFKQHTGLTPQQFRRRYFLGGAGLGGAGLGGATRAGVSGVSAPGLPASANSAQTKYAYTQEV